MKCAGKAKVYDNVTDLILCKAYYTKGSSSVHRIINWLEICTYGQLGLNLNMDDLPISLVVIVVY